MTVGRCRRRRPRHRPDRHRAEVDPPGHRPQSRRRRRAPHRRKSLVPLAVGIAEAGDCRSRLITV